LDGDSDLGGDVSLIGGGRMNGGGEMNGDGDLDGVFGGSLAMTISSDKERFSPRRIREIIRPICNLHRWFERRTSEIDARRKTRDKAREMSFLIDSDVYRLGRRKNKVRTYVVEPWKGSR